VLYIPIYKGSITLPEISSKSTTTEAFGSILKEMVPEYSFL
jgi:hypothetical protein